MCLALMTRKMLFRGITLCLLATTMAILSSLFSASAEAANYLMIGDSRFVGMQEAVGSFSNVYWLDRIGAGSSFFFENESYIDSVDRDTIIIYNLGVNDLNSSLCLDALNALSDKGFRHIWFATVTPVDEAKASASGYIITNDQIYQFDSEVVSNLPPTVGLIDTFTFVWNDGIQTDDGLHYYPSTYIDWFNFMMSQAY